MTAREYLVGFAEITSIQTPSFFSKQLSFMMRRRGNEEEEGETGMTVRDYPLLDRRVK